MAIQPLGTPAAGSSIQPLGSTPSGPTNHTLGESMKVLGDIGGGVLNFVNNNPISRGLTSLSALPVQLGVKGINAVAGTNYPDPYAEGIGSGPGAVHVTSSDQPLGKFAEEEAGNAATVASLFVPVGKIAGGVAPYLAPALGRFAPAAARIGVSGATGAAQGLASGMQARQDISELPSSMRTGALIGGGLATAGELGALLVDNFANTTGASRMAAQTNKLKALQKTYADTSTANTNPIKTMEEKNLIKDLRVVEGGVNVERLTNLHGTGSLDELIQGEQDMGTQAVQAMQGNIPTEDFKKAVISSIKANPALKASGQVGKYVAEIGRRFDDYAESYGDAIPYKNVDDIRVAMNKVWNPDTWDAEKAIGNAARDVLYNGSGAGTTLQSAMQNEKELINAKEFLQKMAGTKVKGGAIGKYITDLGAGIVGSIISAPGGPVVQGITAPAAALAADKLMGLYQKNYFSPMLSGSAQRLQNAVSTPAVSAAARVGKSLMISGAVK